MRQNYDRLITALSHFIPWCGWSQSAGVPATAIHKYKLKVEKINLKFCCICTCSYNLSANLPDQVLF